MKERNYKRKLSSRILIQDDLMETCSTKSFQLNELILLLLLFFGKEKTFNVASNVGLHLIKKSAF